MQSYTCDQYSSKNNKTYFDSKQNCSYEVYRRANRNLAELAAGKEAVKIFGVKIFGCRKYIRPENILSVQAVKEQGGTDQRHLLATHVKIFRFVKQSL